MNNSADAITTLPGDEYAYYQSSRVVCCLFIITLSFGYHRHYLHITLVMTLRRWRYAGGEARREAIVIWSTYALPLRIIGDGY